MRIVSFALVGLVLAQPVVARAECHSAPECLQHIGYARPDPLFALITAALAAPVILAGAAVTAGHEVGAERPLPSGVLTIAPAGKSTRPQLKLALLPTADPPPPPAPVSTRERQQDQRRLQINDTITNVGLAVGGAAVITGIIVGIVKK